MDSFLDIAHPDNSQAKNFVMSDVISYFGLQNVGTSNNDLRWKAIMVSTFELVSLDVIANLITGDNLSRMEAIDWPSAQVLVAGQIGATSAGLNRASNSTFKTLYGISEMMGTGAPFELDNVIFAPFAAQSTTAWEDVDTAYSNFKTSYNNLKDRIAVSTKMFTNLTATDSKGVTRSIPDGIDYLYQGRYDGDFTLENMVTFNGDTEPGILNGLMQRMAFTMVDYRDTLSDCVTERVINLVSDLTVKTPIDGFTVIEALPTMEEVAQ